MARQYEPQDPLCAIPARQSEQEQENDDPNLCALTARQSEQEQEHDDPDRCAFTARQYEQEHDDPDLCAITARQYEPQELRASTARQYYKSSQQDPHDITAPKTHPGFIQG